MISGMFEDLHDLRALEYYNILLDLYAPLLTDRQQEVACLFFEEDLSLSEIAEKMDISRQGVSDHLRRATQTLENLEKALGCLRRESELKREIMRLAESSSDASSSAALRELADRLKFWKE